MMNISLSFIKTVIDDHSPNRITMSPLVNNNFSTPIETHVYRAINASAIYNLSHEIGRICSDFLSEAQEKKIELSLTFKGDIPVAFWDINSLRTNVFNHLLSRLIRNTPVRGKIAILVTKLDDYTMSIRISNSELGAPDTEMESVFLNHQEMDRYFSDSGVEFNNAFQCVRLHKGTLNVVDEPAFPGLTFEIIIPLYCLCIQ